MNERASCANNKLSGATVTRKAAAATTTTTVIASNDSNNRQLCTLRSTDNCKNFPNLVRLLERAIIGKAKLATTTVTAREASDLMQFKYLQTREELAIKQIVEVYRQKSI